LNHGVEKFMVIKFMVEKSGVEMSSFYKVKEQFYPELLNPMVQKFIAKFMVEKLGVERLGIQIFRKSV
jgi:hypothetical protein